MLATALPSLSLRYACPDDPEAFAAAAAAWVAEQAESVQRRNLAAGAAHGERAVHCHHHAFFCLETEEANVEAPPGGTAEHCLKSAAQMVLAVVGHRTSLGHDCQAGPDKASVQGLRAFGQAPECAGLSPGDPGGSLTELGGPGEEGLGAGREWGCWTK